MVQRQQLQLASLRGEFELQHSFIELQPCHEYLDRRASRFHGRFIDRLRKRGGFCKLQIGWNMARDKIHAFISSRNEGKPTWEGGSTAILRETNVRMKRGV